MATSGDINIGFTITGPATGLVRILINGTAKPGATGQVDRGVTVLPPAFRSRRVRPVWRR